MTILELLIAMAIFGITSFVAVLNLSDLGSSFNRNNARQSLESDLRRAREEALAAGARAIVKISNSGTSYTIGLDSVPYSNPAVADQILTTREMPDGITITSTQALIFDSRGYVIDANGVLANVDIALTDDTTTFFEGTLYPTGLLQSY